MNWSVANDMIKRVIKTDVIASEDAYFMATHVPFSNLEVLRGGQQLVDGSSLHRSEEDVYQQLIYNPNNVHRMIIVRGSNGTGKSHLIRWLCARYKNDKERYDESTEKIIFLRRLSNTIRGAVKQILDENIVFDPEMKAKFEKFVSSSQAMDPNSFKLNIYHQFIVALSSDSENNVYSRGTRKDLAAFLSDPRVEQHMLRPGGPIDRCFNAITAPSGQIFKGEVTFTEDDFNLTREIKRSIKGNGSIEAQNILDEITDESYVKKLVSQLNSFTPKVIQCCADISSEGTKEVFLQLRRELKKQNKNLTIFIEDFTAFTGIDSELITVLASEHGGVNSDLCRVTSVIGITDQYYMQFRGNFTNRVEYQVFVNASAYGTTNFLEEMTARYLNAIYCDPKAIEAWFASGAKTKDIPVSVYKPNYTWDTATVEGKEMTLFPFNKKSVLTLYEGLSDSGRGHEKTPRMFLLYVIKEQLERFIDGATNAQWRFPSAESIACPILLENAGHDSAIDSMNHLSADDRRRAKVLLQFWGDGTASATETSIGCVPRAFFSEIALGKFSGFGGTEITANQGGEADCAGEESNDDIIDGANRIQLKNLQDRISDINAWFSTGTTMHYSADYRKWLREFLQECISWPSEGIPAYIAGKRLTESAAVYIEGQRETTPKEKAIIALERTVEARDLLTALTYKTYAKTWGFKSGVYFQQRTISWLEENRKQIVDAVTQNVDYITRSDFVVVCVGLEYLQAAFLGIPIPQGNPIEVAKKLLEHKKPGPQTAKRASGNKAWQDAVRYLESHIAEYTEYNERFKESLRTFMGTDVSDRQSSVGFFRGNEILNAIEYYQEISWEITPFECKKDSGIFKVSDYMNSLLSKIQSATNEEDKLSQTVLDRISAHIGIIDETSVARLITSVFNMIQAHGNINCPVDQTLRNAFCIDAMEQAKKIVGLCARLECAIKENNHVKKLFLYASDPISELIVFANNLDEIKKLATATLVFVNKEKASLAGGTNIEDVMQKGRDYLKNAIENVRGMEAQINAN